MKLSVKIFLIILFSILIIWLLIRLISPREIDDVHPLRDCSQERAYIEEADILWIMPLYENYPISENKTWCKETLSLNKTLGMHGITHSYWEFKLNKLTQEDLNNGIQEFEKCFGEKPELFKPPYLHINKENKDLIRQNGLILKYRFNQAIHKVYHCKNSGRFPNWFIDLF